MTVLRFDLTKNDGKFKILNATNGGPWHKRHANDQYRSNFEDYKKARIPYSRNHDSNFNSVYGAPFCHDISAIFPNFDADENDANSYDFACTDEAPVKKKRSAWRAIIPLAGLVAAAILVYIIIKQFT